MNGSNDEQVPGTPSYGVPPQGSDSPGWRPEGQPTGSAPAHGGGEGPHAIVPNVVGLDSLSAYRHLAAVNLVGAFVHLEAQKATAPVDTEASPAPAPAAGSDWAPVGPTVVPASEADVPPGQVLEQNPPAGAKALPGSQVECGVTKAKSHTGLIVGIAAVVVLLLIGGVLALMSANKADQVAVPKVTGASLESAQMKLTTAGLTLGTVTKQKVAGPANIILDQDPDGGVQAKKNTAVNLVVSETASEAVPTVVGMTSTVAKQTLTAAGFVVGVVTPLPSPQPAGQVLSQSPASGAAPAGSKVDLVVSSGAETVPNVVGLTSAEASQKLVDDGLVVAVTYVQTSGAPAGVVVSQDPAAGTSQKDGTTVTIAVAKTPPPAPVPTKTVTATPTPVPTKTVTATPTPTDTPIPTPLPS